MSGFGPQHPGQCRHEQEQAFHADASHRLDRGQLAQQAIQRERDRKADGDPRHPASLPGQPGHANSRQSHRQPLQLAQPLPQHQHAQQHTQQRIDEVAQAGFHHMSGVHRPDVQAPVEADHRAGQAEQPEGARHRADLPHPVQPLAYGQQHEQQHRAPHDAVGDDLVRRHLLEQMPVQREQAPDDEGQRGGPQAVAIVAAAHVRRTRARVMTTTPARITAIAPISAALKRSCAIHAPSATAITGFT